jgi:hypothetical protein
VSAQDRQFWAFRPLARPVVPGARQEERVRTPVDSLLLARLESHGFTFSPDVDRLTLLRRASFDLLGLPPSPEECAAFLADDRPGAYEGLLDRLLASPHFGERWGRHWLDGAGYVDVLGGDNDAAIVKLGDGKWRYRDYVVCCFNEDRPFARFLTEQIAGDELVDWRLAAAFTTEVRESLIATGFLRCAADDTDENELNTPGLRHAVLQRTAEILASNLLALTLNCAKCHDHKFEPISQRDYYRLQAVLAPAFNPQAWVQPKERALPDVAAAEKAEIERHNAAVSRQVEDFTARLAGLRRPCEERLFEQKLASLPEPIRADTRDAVRTEPAKRGEVQKYLVAKFEAALRVSPEEVTASLSPQDRAAAAELSRQIAELNGSRKGWGTIQAVYDTGPPTPTHLLRRGNHEAPGEEVAPGFLSVLSPSDAAAVFPETEPAGSSSGRRLALARRLTDWEAPSGALVARVRVNRVWQHLFGTGIVESADNFGLSGARPAHPELLEWLAAEFVSNGGRLKPLLKTIMTSTAYRQASAVPAAERQRQVDPDDRLLWRMPLRRLESECVRDALLSVSGKLDPAVGGPPVPTENRPDGTIVVKAQGLPPGTSPQRRSLYLLARRNYHPTVLGVFDQPVLTTNCTRRASSAVVLQALTMLNDVFVLEQAGALAERVAREAGPEPGPRVERAFRVALGRPPSAAEAEWSAALLRRQSERYQAAGSAPEQAARQGLARLCHVLLNTNEFLSVP